MHAEYQLAVRHNYKVEIAGLRSPVSVTRLRPGISFMPGNRVSAGNLWRDLSALPSVIIISGWISGGFDFDCKEWSDARWGVHTCSGFEIVAIGEIRHIVE